MHLLIQAPLANHLHEFGEFGNIIDRLGLNGINIKDSLGSGMVTKLLMVTGETEKVANTYSYSPQYIPLKCQPVPVSDDHLHYRFHAYLFQERTSSHARHAHDSRLIVGYVDSIAAVTKHLPFSLHHCSTGALGRARLGSDSKLPTFKYFLQIRSCLHLRCLLLVLVSLGSMKLNLPPLLASG